MNALTSIRFDRTFRLIVSGKGSLTKRKQSRRFYLAWMLTLGIVGGMTPGAIASIESSTLDRSSNVSSIESQVDSSPLLVSQNTTSFTLRLGSSGHGVTALQESLADLGYYDGPVTGYFGEQTEQAVKNFQSSNGLTADGIVGTGTLAAIANANTTASATSGAIREGSTGEQVIALQDRLADLGYYTGTVDGVFGSATTLAVKKFQEQNGLVADGVVGAATETALRSAEAIAATSTTTSTATSQTSTTTSATAASDILQLGSSGRDVIVLQSQLQALGYFSGPVDGSFGQSTKDAVMLFQSEQGLVADGLVGPQTTYLLDEQFFAIQSATLPAATAIIVNPSAQPIPTPGPTPTVVTAPTVVSPTPPPMAFPSAAPLPGQSTPTTVAPAAVAVPTAPPATTIPQAVLPSATVVVPQAVPVPVQAPVQVVEQGSYSVLEVQQQLYQQGLYSGPLDGVMNAQTEQAIREAQEDHGLSPADIVQ